MTAERLKGRQRFHNLLSDAYGVLVPERDFAPIVVLLDRLEMTQRAISDLLVRFTSYEWGDCHQMVLQVLAEDIRVPPEEVDRVERKLAQWGYRGLSDPFEEPSESADNEPTRLPDDDGPDNLHRLHAMLAGAYPIEIPLSDYVAVVHVLRGLQVSVSGILSLLDRFYPRGKLPTRDEVEAILGGNPGVGGQDIARVEGRMTSHGLAELASVPNPRWTKTKGESDARAPYPLSSSTK